MKFEPVALSEAKGKILGHNIAGPNGQRLLRKEKPLINKDLEKLRFTNPYVLKRKSPNRPGSLLLI
jgi:hypothetical protein